MSPDRIKSLLTHEPFEPFTIRTGDGEDVDVLSREFTLLYPGSRTLRVITPKSRGAKDESDFEEHVIDVFLITKVITPARRQRSNGRKKH